jgi:hypothetical protein
MKLTTFVKQVKDKTYEPDDFLLNRTEVKNGLIQVFNNNYKDVLVGEYTLDKFKINYNDHPDIEFVMIENNGFKITIPYSRNNMNKYCRHTEKMSISLVSFETGETEETKVSCSDCGLEWRN